MAIDALGTPATGNELMARDPAEPSEARRAFVQRVLKDVAEAKKHWKPDFDRMRRNMRFAGGKQWPNQRENDDRYRVNMIQRALKVVVSSLYAKNPTVVYKRRPKLDFTLWDGRPETLMQAQQAVAQAQQMLADPATQAVGMDPTQAMVAAQAVEQAQAVIADVQQGLARRSMMDRIGKTLVTVSSYYVSEAKPGFKLQMKQMVRRARTTGVGYVKLGFQREMELSKKQVAEVNTLNERLATIGRLTADLQDGEVQQESAEADELKAAIKSLQSQPEAISYEGLTFDFPASTKIIPSISTEKLMGWVGAEWIAEEIALTPDRIKEVYGVDVGRSYTSYKTISSSPEGGAIKKDAKGNIACVYHVYDKRTGMELVVCDGYPDFLKEPGEPEIFIEEFFPIFAVTFNDAEEEGRLFPESDVENLTPLQKEYNRANEAKRQHRIANRPLYVAPKGAFEGEEVKALSSYAAHEVIELNGINERQKAQDLLQPVQKIGVDPNLYETESIFADMQRVTGNAEATFGSTAGGTATENQIAESSRQGTLGLDTDDLDDMLTSLFRAAGQVALGNLSAETVKAIAGPGAVWPELSRQEIMDELWLEVKAGSSGRPNAAADAAKFERIYPLLVQVPGVSPEWLAKKAIMIADDDADLEEAFIEGMASITAMNQLTQPSTGNPETDPNAQGGKGGDNAEKPHQQRDNGQPGFNDGPQQNQR
jgi:hypothetical protein